ncbi:helix-turn-helix domain-containing protein [Geodermatophilus sp. URMC 62]|uniref:helix-turn-helix domain-containing protein n=1 Tax=Geodermatophilus sp. URMC 62 TaxID=3423414 RepID=UPI00406C36EB
MHEVFHARFTEHSYPSHTHDTWTLLIVDDGMVRYGLDRYEHGAVQAWVTLLPPDVPHDGRPVGPEGFRKRVLYLERDVLDDGLIGAAVDEPSLADPLLRYRVHQLHQVLTYRSEDLEAHSRLVLIRERLLQHLGAKPRAAATRSRDPGVAQALRDLLDARVEQGVSLGEAAEILDERHPAHLVRTFRREFGIPPHLYLTGRRVDLARRFLLSGHTPAQAATMAGFYDQSHLARHFRRFLGISPAHYARSKR